VGQSVSDTGRPGQKVMISIADVMISNFDMIQISTEITL